MATELAPGTEIALEIRGEYRRTRYIAEELVRTTPTRLVTSAHGSFPLSGTRPGPLKTRVRIVPMTDEIRRAMRAEGLASELAGFDWGGLPAETLEAILKTARAAEAAQAGTAP
jgi:hypothetical protein